MDATTGYEALSFMDGYMGYNQIRMAPEDEELTAFRTPKGVYCYKVMPFGLKNAGATKLFLGGAMAMTLIFGDLLHDIIECYVDDLVVKTKRRADHLKDLQKIFDRLRKHQLKMNPLRSNVCAFGVTSGKFPGFLVRHRSTLTRAGIVTTGSEVAEGLIEDAFTPVVACKIGRASCRERV